MEKEPAGAQPAPERHKAAKGAVSIDRSQVLRSDHVVTDAAHDDKKPKAQLGQAAEQLGIGPLCLSVGSCHERSPLSVSSLQRSCPRTWARDSAHLLHQTPRQHPQDLASVAPDCEELVKKMHTDCEGSKGDWSRPLSPVPRPTTCQSYLSAVDAQQMLCLRQNSQRFVGLTYGCSSQGVVDRYQLSHYNFLNMKLGSYPYPFERNLVRLIS